MLHKGGMRPTNTDMETIIFKEVSYFVLQK